MAQHDRYDTDILKQLTRIANSLEKIEKKMPDIENRLNIFQSTCLVEDPALKGLQNLKERLGYGEKRLIDVSEMLGKTLVEIIGMEPVSEEIIFKCSDGTSYKMYHDQDCCEYVRVEDVIGNVEDLVGFPLLMCEDISNDNEDPDYDKYCDFEHTWTWYKFATIKGYVTVRWLGESNGYYSESVDFKEIKND